MKFIFEDLAKRLNFTGCTDICASGIPRFGISPLLNASDLYFTDNNINRTHSFHSVNENIENYIITCSVNHSPDDWTGFHGNVPSLFSLLNEKYLRDLKNGKAILMLDQSFEGYHTPWLFEWFHNELNKYNISPKQIVYVTGNMIIDEIYENWCVQTNTFVKMKVIGYPHFELDVGLTAFHMSKDDEYKLPTFEDQVKYKFENLNNIKTFACLNKRVRPQRVFFYDYLLNSGLLDKGMVSMNTIDEDRLLFEGKILEKEEIIKLNNTLPKLVYDKPNNELDDNFYIRRFNDKICLDTFFTVISEAQCGDSNETLFISEKTYKVIACRQPFIVMGNRETLRKLRETGYKTFDGFIDEGYDYLPTHERMQYIIESIRKIDNIEDKLAWYKSMEEIIEHNYKTFISKLFKRPDAFVEMEKYSESLFNVEEKIVFPEPTSIPFETIPKAINNTIEKTNMIIDRKYLPTLAELIDRMSISQLKEQFIPEHKEEYSAEIKDIQHDVQLLLNEKGIDMSAETIRAIVVLAQTNLHIWHNESNYRRGIKDGNNLELTHGLNGVRNTAKNKIQEIVGGRKDYKIDCLAADFKDWGISW